MCTAFALITAWFIATQSAAAQTQTPPTLTPIGTPDVSPADVERFPPSISPIADQAIDEDGSTGPIRFTLTDLDTDASDLSVSGSASDGVLVPLSSIVFGGSGANRTVTITPPPDLNGAARILIIVSDGSASTFTDFDLTVRPVNDPPAISAIADQTTSEDVRTPPITFTVSDVDNALGDLDIEGNSSNRALLPLSRIAFSGNGPTRTVRLTPMANQFGTSAITITVNDGEATRSTSFRLTVNAVNDAPVLTQIADQATAEDTPLGPITFTLSDVDAPTATLSLSAASSNVELVPTTNISIGLANKPISPTSVAMGTEGEIDITAASAVVNHLLYLTPAPNQFGTAQITLTASDGIAVVTSTFALNVAAVNDPPTLSAIADQVNTGEPIGPLSFQVNDVDNPIEDVRLTVATSRPDVVPLRNIQLAGQGISRTLLITPLQDVTNTVFITINASDGDATSQTAFALRDFNFVFAPVVMLNPACDAASTDCFEPNDAFADASLITSGQTQVASRLTGTDTRDYYAITLTAGQQYVFDLQTGGVDLDLYLYGSAPTYPQLTQANVTGPQDETITFVPGTTGTYYLLVYNYYNTAPPLIKPYALKIS